MGKLLSGKFAVAPKGTAERSLVFLLQFKIPVIQIHGRLHDIAGSNMPFYASVIADNDNYRTSANAASPARSHSGFLVLR